MANGLFIFRRDLRTQDNKGLSKAASENDKLNCFFFLDPKQIGKENIFTFVAALLLLFFINLILFWPGQISPDSIAQLKQATTGLYSNHHPPIMAFLWRYLLKIFPYASGMLIFHLTLLYSSCYIFFQAFKNYRLKYFYLFFPFFPPILFYSSMIWKDVGFAFSFLFVAASLSYFILHKIKPSFFQLFGIYLVLFYGAAVKFQAIFCIPPLILAICITQNNFKINKKTILQFLLSTVCLIVSINIFNDFLVSKTEHSDSWKFVKVYDLAGISI